MKEDEVTPTVKERHFHEDLEAKTVLMTRMSRVALSVIGTGTEDGNTTRRTKRERKIIRTKTYENKKKYF